MKKLVLLVAVIVSGCSVVSTNFPPVDPEKASVAEVGKRAVQRRVQALVPVPVVTTPMHLAVSNPNVTDATVEHTVRDLFAGSVIDTLSVVKTTMEWAKTNLNYVSPTFLPESSLWGVEVTGTLVIKDPLHRSGQQATGHKSFVALDVEAGVPIALTVLK